MEADTDLIERKQQARAAASRRRRAAAEADDGTVLPAIVDRLLGSGVGHAESVVSGYLAMGSELDIRPLLARLRKRGHLIVLPCVVGRGRPLVFREWLPDTPLIREPFGNLAPDASSPRRAPDLLLVPLLAFDRKGYRLGYGGGFYDRTLDSLREHGDVLAVGVAYAAQEAESVPHDETDARLDLIVTEHEVITP